MNPSFGAFAKVMTNMAMGVKHVPKNRKLNQTDGKLFAAKKGEAPRSDMVFEAEAAEKEAKVQAHLKQLAAEARSRAGL